MPVERRGNVNEKNGKSNVPKKSYSPSGPDVRSKETTEHTSESKNFWKNSLMNSFSSSLRSGRRSLGGILFSLRWSKTGCCNSFMPKQMQLKPEGYADDQNCSSTADRTLQHVKFFFGKITIIQYLHASQSKKWIS